MLGSSVLRGCEGMLLILAASLPTSAIGLGQGADGCWMWCKQGPWLKVIGSASVQVVENMSLLAGGTSEDTGALRTRPFSHLMLKIFHRPTWEGKGTSKETIIAETVHQNTP